jgi:hypothetical protein
MIQANAHNSITSRRRFLTVSAAASVASVGTLAVAAMPPGGLEACAQDDGALLALEEKFFEQHELAHSCDDEIRRLSAIWHAEANRLWEQSLSGHCTLTEDERWNLVGAMPECVESERLHALQTEHYNEIDAIIREMWATPAHTAEGRRAKVLVALNLLPRAWRVPEEESDYGVREVRQLLREFVGGDAGEQLRKHFA